MDLEIHEINKGLLGKRLGQKIYSPKGGLLLGMGAEIKEFHYRKIGEVGYKSVYTLNNPASDVIDCGDHVLTEKLRASAPLVLKGVFDSFLSKDKIKISNAKKELSALTDSIIREVNIKMQQAPKILDLKREKDYLYQHAINVAGYAVLIGESMQYHQLKLFDLAQAALLADFGMLYVDEAILFKPEALTPEETENMRKHTLLGFQHLGRNCFIKGLVAVVALQHHERWNGSGYPKGSVGEDVHEYSRIVALADFFDAYTSDRPYRRLHTIQQAINFIKDQDGILFDSRMVRHFLKFFE